MRLFQIPFSHNCIKVRRAFELKGLDYETTDIAPMDRKPVRAASGQGMVPTLVDGDQSVVDSTNILRHLEQKHPTPSLLPEDPALHAECWLIEDWADRAFMERTRRLAYWYRIQETPDVIAERFFPNAGGFRRKMMMRAARRLIFKRFRISESRNRRDEAALPQTAELAMQRLGGRPRFFGERTTVADVGLATMVAPLYVVGESLRKQPAVAQLLDWAEPILGEAVMRQYRNP